MKIAIIHEWLSFYGGAERVLKELLTIFPRAVVFTLIDTLPERDRAFLKNIKINTSFLQKIPLARKYYRSFLSLMTYAVEEFDLSNFDLIISSSHCIAKGVLTGPDQLHICICHSPVRYAWDMQHEYLEQTGLNRGIKGLIAKRMLHKMRLWDIRSSNGVDTFIAVSHFIRRRIMKVYKREAHVIYSPVDVSAFDVCSEKKDYYLAASRLVPYKKIGLIVEAFRDMPDKKLVVIGDGPEYKKIMQSKPSNVEILGYQPFNVLQTYMQEAKAFIFAPKEDFGIIPIEAQACGTPVIAYGKGGALETVRGINTENPTGLFFYEQTSKAIQNAVNSFENNQRLFSPKNCRTHAESFSAERYRKEVGEYILSKYREFQNELQKETLEAMGAGYESTSSK